MACAMITGQGSDVEVYLVADGPKDAEWQVESQSGRSRSPWRLRSYDLSTGRGRTRRPYDAIQHPGAAGLASLVHHLASMDTAWIGRGRGWLEGLPVTQKGE